jgi:hypothetical protein
MLKLPPSGQRLRHRMQLLIVLFGKTHGTVADLLFWKGCDIDFLTSSIASEREPAGAPNWIGKPHLFQTNAASARDIQ